MNLIKERKICEKQILILTLSCKSLGLVLEYLIENSIFGEHFIDECN